MLTTLLLYNYLGPPVVSGDEQHVRHVSKLDIPTDPH